EAVFVVGAFRLFRAVPVPGRNLRTPDANFPHLANAQVGAVVSTNDYLGRGDRQTNGPIEVPAVKWVDGDGRRRFREPVGLRKRGAFGLQPASLDRLLHRHAAAERELHAGKVELRESRVVQQGVEQCVDARNSGESRFRQTLYKRGDVSRIQDQQIIPAQLEEG